jgi:hypothetical protein
MIACSNDVQKIIGAILHKIYVPIAAKDRLYSI